MRIRDMEGAKAMTALAQVNEMKREKAVRERELGRMEARLQELEARVVKCPERKARFIQRLKGEMREQRTQIDMLAANIAGMEAEA